MEDISLTFDNKMFLKGLEEISKKLESLVGSTEKSTEKISKGVSISAMSFLKINAALSFAKMGISKLMSNIPEIGRTFQIAGDVITRNFLFPLRQQLMPYLQKFLNWVRDHRAMFVRWGAVLVNVFQVVVQGVKSAINILKPFYEAAVKLFQKIFGGTVDSIDKLSNMVMFKISAIVIYIETVLAPVMRSLADSVLSVAEGFIEFVEGIKIGMSYFDGFIDDIRQIIDLFSILIGKSQESTGAMKLFGETIGFIVGGALKLLLGVLKAIGASLVVLKSGILLIMGKEKEANELINNMGKSVSFGESPEELAERMYAPKTTGPVLSMEEIMAGKGSTVATKNKTVDNSSKVNITNLTVNASTEEGGQKAGRALYSELKNQMNTGKAVRGH